MPGSVFKRCGCRAAVTGRMLGAACELLPLEGHGSWYLCMDPPPEPDGRRHRLRRGGFAAGRTRAKPWTVSLIRRLLRVGRRGCWWGCG